MKCKERLDNKYEGRQIITYNINPLMPAQHKDVSKGVINKTKYFCMTSARHHLQISWFINDALETPLCFVVMKWFILCNYIINVYLYVN